MKYETGPVADLLKSVKRNFGTEGHAPEQTRETKLLRWVNPAGEGADDGTGDQSRNGSFGNANDRARENWEEALRAVRNYLSGVGPTLCTPTLAKYPSADEIAKRLSTTENAFHRP